jgi:hypothetical protein
MAISEAFQSSQSVTTTEHSLPRDATYDSAQPQTTDGIYQIFLDLNALAVGDVFQFRVYEAISSGGTTRVVYETMLAGVQGSPMYVTPSLILMHKWDATLFKIAGSDQTISWSIRSVA